MERVGPTRARRATEDLKKAVEGFRRKRGNLQQNVQIAIKTVAGLYRIKMGPANEDRIIEMALKWIAGKGGFFCVFEGLPCTISEEEKVADALMGVPDEPAWNGMTQSDDSS